MSGLLLSRSKGSGLRAGARDRIDPQILMKLDDDGARSLLRDEFDLGETRNRLVFGVQENFYLVVCRAEGKRTRSLRARGAGKRKRSSQQGQAAQVRFGSRWNMYKNLSKGKVPLSRRWIIAQLHQIPVARSQVAPA